ncbi:MAG TPA: response regulator [Longimicrobiales bacterium]|nr:response regulator [Longimicrobiales bacterium]
MITQTQNRVLVVEDDAAIRRMMTTHFRRNGFLVDYAMSAEEVASDEAYDLVVTDVHLPGQSGVELARRIRRTRPQQTFVFMTGDADESVARDALDTGAAGYLLKPFEFFELDAVVNTALAGRSAAKLPYKAHSHVTKKARVVLTPRQQPRSRKTPVARLFAAVGMMLSLAFGVGAALQPKLPAEPVSPASEVSAKPIVVPVVLDRSVYITQKAPVAQ